MRMAKMNRDRMARRRGGHDEDRPYTRLREGEQTSMERDALGWKDSVARFAPVAALVIVLLAACASAFSMLIWEPAADPAAAAVPTVASGHSGRLLSAQTRRDGRFAGARREEILCSLVHARRMDRLLTPDDRKGTPSSLPIVSRERKHATPAAASRAGRPDRPEAERGRTDGFPSVGWLNQLRYA